MRPSLLSFIEEKPAGTSGAALSDRDPLGIRPAADLSSKSITDNSESCLRMSKWVCIFSVAHLAV